MKYVYASLPAAGMRISCPEAIQAWQGQPFNPLSMACCRDANTTLKGCCMGGQAPE